MNRDEDRLFRLTMGALHQCAAGEPVQAVVGCTARTGPAVDLPPAPGKARLQKWSIPRTIEWLKCHAGVGGACAAEWLERSAKWVAVWMVILHREWLEISAVNRFGRVTESATRYDGLNTTANESSGADHGPGSATLTLDDEPLVVRATDLATAELGAGLAYAAASGRLHRFRRPAESAARKIDLPVGQAELSLLLRTAYAGRPEAVAAALEALWRFCPGMDQELIEAMDGCAELRGLRARVAKLTKAAGRDRAKQRPGER